MPGRIYRLALAIHAGDTAKRFHDVSLDRTIAIGSGKADLVAVTR